MIVLAHHERRAAHGRHRCVWCCEPIAARESYIDLRIADGGTCWTQRQHTRCLDLVDRYGAFHALDAEEPLFWEDVLAWANEEHLQ